MRVYIGLIGLDGLQIISLALHDVDVDDKWEDDTETGFDTSIYISNNLVIYIYLSIYPSIYIYLSISIYLYLSI